MKVIKRSCNEFIDRISILASELLLFVLISLTDLITFCILLIFEI